jgi:hypothetical protein
MLQPIFKPSDCKFNSREVLLSALVAADCAGNEWGVKVVKNSAFLRAGINQRSEVRFYCKAWLAFAFQSNFMYKAVM